MRRAKFTITVTTDDEGVVKTNDLTLEAYNIKQAARWLSSMLEAPPRAEEATFEDTPTPTPL
jgi:hypothetical protein